MNTIERPLQRVNSSNSKASRIIKKNVYNQKTNQNTLENIINKTKAIIVGTGFSGLCMAFKLKEAGINDFIILEKASQLGGTWRENTYPGAECDIPSVLYSYSFAPNPDWQHKWSDRQQIHQYQQTLSDQYELETHFKFNQTVESAHFDETKKVWNVRCASGEDYQTDHFISAVGQLHEVFQPAIKGLSDYAGESFHSAQWNSAVDLKGKRVAVIGNAASAVQLIPEIAKQASSLTVFQRSANWMIMKSNRSYSKFEKWLFKHLPFTQKLIRLNLWVLAELVLHPAVKGKKIHNFIVMMMVKFNLRKHIKDPELRKKLTPNYPLGAKRTLFSHEYYQTLERDKVNLETATINSFTNSGLKTNDEREIAFDVVIFATGFQTNPFLQSLDIRGVNQLTLKDHWHKGAHAYLGLHTSGFPNMHILYGPNTNLGHNSVIAMIEAQVAYVINAITTADKQQGKKIEVRQDHEQSYNEVLQQRLRAMAFGKVEKSWYIDQGKITNNWPGTATEYQRRLAKIDWSAYH